MALKLRPTGLGSGIDEDPDYSVYSGGGMSAACTRPAAVQTVCAFLVDDRQRSDDTIEPRGDLEETKAQFQKSWDG